MIHVEIQIETMSDAFIKDFQKEMDRMADVVAQNIKEWDTSWSERELKDSKKKLIGTFRIG